MSTDEIEKAPDCESCGSPINEPPREICMSAFHRNAQPIERWVDSHFDRWLDPLDRSHCIKDLTAFVREQVEKALKAADYHRVVDIHRQYGREVRLRDVCRWLVQQVDPGPGPRYVHPYLKLADALREHFAKEDAEYDDRDDVLAFETRIAALEAEQQNLHDDIQGKAHRLVKLEAELNGAKNALDIERRHGNALEAQLEQCGACERIKQLEAALAEMIGTHGEPCREQMATGEACESVNRARTILRGTLPPVGPPLHAKIRLMREALEKADDLRDICIDCRETREYDTARAKTKVTP